MTVSASSFVQSFPEFADSTLYPPQQIDFWITWGQAFLDPSVWSTWLDMGISMFVAHNLVLERQAQAAAQNGAVPGVNTGPVSAKSVDKVSISYDTGAAALPDAGHWNLTTYGTRYRDLVRRVGVGAILSNLPGFGMANGTQAYAGPWVFLGPNPQL